MTGSDRIRYLNGQITNDIRKATSDTAIYAAVLNAKGRMDADAFIRADRDSFLVDADAALRELLTPRLERYIIADDVQVEDVSDEFALFHLVGFADAGVTAERFGRAGLDLWLSGAEREAKLRELAASAELMDERRAETFRIERGVARWGFDLSSEIIPLEANLESRAIDFAKGCYIGQEVISRMKMSGQVNKRLCGVVSTNDEPLRRGARLFAPADGTREVGWITSPTRSDALHKHIALAFIKRGHNSPGTKLVTDDCTVDVVGLPFV